MNQDQVKQCLLDVADSPEYFSVIFTGKQSKKVDGLYYPEKREILIHNKNMKSDNQLLYTALHEYAHHLHFCSTQKPVSNRAHTRDFWNLFHELLDTAEKKGIVKNEFRLIPEFQELTVRLKNEYILKNGQIMKEFGSLLTRAAELCQDHHLSFEDYVDRELGIHRHSAKTIIGIHKKDINPSIGYENMTRVSRIRDLDQRRQAEKAFEQGLSPDRVLSSFPFAGNKTKADTQDLLLSEKARLEKTIATLSKKLEHIKQQIRQADIAAE